MIEKTPKSKEREVRGPVSPKDSGLSESTGEFRRRVEETGGSAKHQN